MKKSKRCVRFEFRRCNSGTHDIAIFIPVLMLFIYIQTICNSGKDRVIEKSNQYATQSPALFRIRGDALRGQLLMVGILPFMSADLQRGKLVSFQNDQELISQCLSGSGQAWSLLYRRVYRPVHFVTHWHRWHFSADEAQELMQDIFMNLVTSLASFKGDCSLETFATTIAKHRCVSEIRKIRAQKREGAQSALSLSDPDHEGTLQTALEDKKSSFHLQVENTQTLEVLEQALQGMQERCRAIIRLKYYEDRSYDDMCYLLSLPMGTIASRLKRCLEELKTLCEKLTGGAP